MTAFPSTRRRLGLSQAAIARITGVQVRTVERWEAGTCEVPPPVERLLWACERDPTLALCLASRDRGVLA